MEENTVQKTEEKQEEFFPVPLPLMQEIVNYLQSCPFAAVAKILYEIETLNNKYKQQQ